MPGHTHTHLICFKSILWDIITHWQALCSVSTSFRVSVNCKLKHKVIGDDGGFLAALSVLGQVSGVGPMSTAWCLRGLSIYYSYLVFGCVDLCSDIWRQSFEWACPQMDHLIQEETRRCFCNKQPQATWRAGGGVVVNVVTERLNIV